MDADFWHARWARGEIGFHRDDANPLLVKHFSALSLPAGARVLVPLCGKTRDIGWLLQQGCRVVGIELTASAVAALFADLGLTPEITDAGELQRYHAAGIDVYVGDFFVVSRDVLGEVDAVYDRAAIVALPEAMRARYTAHLVDITQAAPQLLICYEYDQSKTHGPPFSVSDAAVRQYYEPHYALTQLDDIEVPGGLRGECAAREKVWLLERN